MRVLPFLASPIAPYQGSYLGTIGFVVLCLAMSDFAGYSAALYSYVFPSRGVAHVLWPHLVVLVVVGTPILFPSNEGSPLTLFALLLQSFVSAGGRSHA